MGTEAQTTNTETTTEQAKPATAAAVLPIIAEASKSSIPAQGASTPPVASVERIPTRKLLSEDNDDIPADTELFEMSARALKSRLDRATKKQLKDRFGVDDFDTIKAQLDELETFKKEREEQRLAQMGEVDRLKEQLSRAEQSRVVAETQSRELRENQIVDKEDRRVQNIASQYLDPDYIDVEVPRLAKYLYSCSEEELKNADTLIKEWFEKRVSEKPKLSKDYEAAKAAAEKPAPRQVPLSNGANVEKPTSGVQSGAMLQKTAAPGKANSMTPTELREYKRANGLNW